MARKIIRGGLLIAAALAVSLMGGEASAQARGRGDQRCIRDLATSALESVNDDQLGIAQACRDTAISERGANAVRARFYSGRAYARAGNLDEAIAQLEIAVNAGRDFMQLGPELRAAKLELAQAYRTSGRTEPAGKILGTLSDGDPSVAYQKALLSLVERGAAGQQSAFESLRVFASDDRSLIIAMSPQGQPAKGVRTATPVTASPGVLAEIQRGRSWLYRLGRMLGQQRLDAGDPRGAMNYFGPVADVVNRACPEPGPVQCATSVSSTETVGSLSSVAEPTADQMLKSFYDLGIASLRAAGLQDTLGLGGFATEMGGIGALDCIGSQTGPDATGYFDVAARAFQTYIRRSNASAASAATAHWGLACTILAAQGSQPFGADPVRLNEAIIHLNQAPQNSGLTFVTKARAYILQGEVPSALDSYKRALKLLNADRCGSAASSGQGLGSKAQSRIYLEMARMQYAPGRIRTAVPGQQGSGPSELFDRVITDVSYAQAEPLLASETYLKCAIDYDAANTEARLSLANLYLRLGGEMPQNRGIDPPPFRKAEQVLKYFRDRGERNVEGAAEAYYLLSRRMTLARQFQLDPAKSVAWKGGLSETGGTERDAVQFAARAYGLSQRALYRSQACLSQILFGVIGEQSLCAATGDGNDLTQAYFYEGLYWLRRGQREGPGDRRLDSWARAIRAFNLGAERENGISVDPIDPVLRSRPPLSELMLFGQRYTLKCILKKDPGGDIDRASQEVRNYFLYAGIPSACGGGAS